MRILLQQGDDPFGATELFITLIDAASDSVVWALDVEGDERVFFETTNAVDALDVLDGAFAARLAMKEENNG